MIPAFAGKLAAHEERFLNAANRIVQEIHECYSLENFSLNRGARRLDALLTEISGLFYRNLGTRDDANTLNLVRSALASWASLLTPLMPDYGQALSQALGSGDLFQVRASTEARQIRPLASDLMAGAREKLQKFQAGTNATL